MKPVIGITMCFDTSGLVRPNVDYSLIRSEYGAQIKAAGGSPIFLEHNIDPVHAVELCDGIVISGGEDIHPTYYDEWPSHINIYEPPERTAWERLLIDACDRNNVKILGICYGAQLLNVHYGGTLYQDIATQTGSDLSHGTSTEAALHNVTFEHDFLGFKKGDVVESAARHHQAVRDVAPGFQVVAKAADGIIEAITGYGHYGVQWHSEADDTAHDVYGAFIQTLKCTTPQLAR